MNSDLLYKTMLMIRRRGSAARSSFTKRLRRTQFVLLSLRTQANVDTLKINFSNIYIRYLRYLKSMQLDHG